MNKSNFVERTKKFFGSTGTPGMIKSGLGERLLLLLGLTKIRRRFKYLNVVVGGEEDLGDAWYLEPTLLARKAVRVSRNPVKYLEARLEKAKKACNAKKAEVYEEAITLLREGIVWAEWIKFERFRTLRWEYEDGPF